MSSIVKERALLTRYRAVRMVNGGLTQVQVAKQLKIGPRTLKSGMALDRRGETLENRRDRGRKTAMSRVAKIVDKYALKRPPFTGNWRENWLRSSIPAQSRPCPALRYCLQLKSLKLRRQSRLTAAQRQKRLNFTRARLNWSIQDWRRVIFSEETPFELYHPPNRQNDSVWADNSS